jgi:outer membrane lipoprotein carrier protein
MRLILAALSAVALNLAAAADRSSQLDRYLAGLSTLRMNFTQTLKDARGREVDHASGTLLVSRPGKFRWELHSGADKDSGQLMVADGRNVWFFDRDLQQVTVKPADTALSATPAMLLSGTVDVHENFTVSDAGRRDGLAWQLVEPRRGDAEFRRALFGFTPDGTLKRMIIDDKLGQTATLLFDDVERNAPVTAEELSFTPPPGADLIGTPRK